MSQDKASITFLSLPLFYSSRLVFVHQQNVTTLKSLVPSDCKVCDFFNTQKCGICHTVLEQKYFGLSDHVLVIVDRCQFIYEQRLTCACGKSVNIPAANINTISVRYNTPNSVTTSVLQPTTETYSQAPHTWEHMEGRASRGQPGGHNNVV